MAQRELPEGIDWKAFTPDDSPKTPMDVMSDPAVQRLSTPDLTVGDPAYNFAGPLYDFSQGVETKTDATFELLAAAREKPVALIFGSYTWPPFRAQLGPLHEMWQRYRDRVGFVVVYIREAHPEEGWVVSPNRMEDILVNDPTTTEERVEVAQACALRLEIEMPVVVDDVDDDIASAYGALPDRLYLVDTDGRVAFQCEQGPWGFDPAALESAIKAVLAA